MTPEGKIEAHLKRRVKETGGEIRKLSWIGRRGAPDRMVWWLPGKRFFGIPPLFAFIEVKAPGEKPTAQQVREHCRMREASFRVDVVDSYESVDLMISELTGA